MNVIFKAPNQSLNTNLAFTKSENANTYEKRYYDNGSVIVIYDSKGRMLEIKSVYGDHNTSLNANG